MARRRVRYAWAYSAYRVCVWLDNRWLGTFDSRRPFEIPREAREAIRYARAELRAQAGA